MRFSSLAGWVKTSWGEVCGGGGPGTGNVRPFVALLPTCIARGLRVSCTVSTWTSVFLWEKKCLCQRADNDGVFAGYACHMWACYVAYTAAFHESSVAWLVAHPTTKLKLVREWVHWGFYCHEKYITYCIYGVYFFFLSLLSGTQIDGEGSVSGTYAESIVNGLAGGRCHTVIKHSWFDPFYSWPFSLYTPYVTDQENSFNNQKVHMWKACLLFCWPQCLI